MNEHSLEQLLYAGNYTAAFEKLKTGEKLPKSLQPHQKSQILDNLFRSEQYDIILHLIDDNTIETDIYEFESFDKSIFLSLVRNLKTDQNSLDFFEVFISKLDNLSDEVATQTLLGYFFEKLMPLTFIQTLVNAGCDVNFRTNSEQTYIHQIVRNNERRFDLNDEQLNILKLEYIEYLVNEGVDIDAENVVGKTPLIDAVETNKAGLIKVLLDHGANPNHVDHKGNTAFFYAVAHLQNAAIYDMMRAFELPSFDILNKENVTLLFEYIRTMSVSESGIKLLNDMITDGADLYQPAFYYGKEKTPMEVIAEKPAELLEAVLETGQVDISRSDDNGNTLLHQVCALGVNYEPEKAREIYKKAKLLIAHGANVSALNDKDETPLMLASDDNLKIKTVELLMKST